MIDPGDSLELQITRQQKIIEALIRRANRQHDVGRSAYSLFQSAISLQGQVGERTRELERALDTLGRASNELEVARSDRERVQKNLADAVAAMEGGFALFAEGGLKVSNDLFRRLLPDISHRIVPGLSVDAYFEAVFGSTAIAPARSRDREPGLPVVPRDRGRLSFLLELKDDRWFQFVCHRTTSDTIVVMQTDITDIVRSNRTEKAQLIDQQAHYLQSAFDHMSVGICTFSRDGAIMAHNDRFGDLLNLPYGRLQKGTSVSQVVNFIQANAIFSDTQERDFDRWSARLRAEGRLGVSVRHANGRVLDLNIYRLPTGDYLADVSDVTLETQTTELLEQRVRERTAELTAANQRLREQHERQARVEEELRLAKEAAEVAVSSKTRFLAAASHDLLQPINAAKLLISILGDKTRDTPLAELVERLEGSFQSMESLLNALLDISRLDSTVAALKPRAFCLDGIMRTVIEDNAPLAARKGLRLSAVPSTLWVESDQQYLTRSLQNLVVNAIQYTDQGRVLVGCRRKGSAVVLEVWDTGIGISRKDQKRIFEEFTRADNVKPGSGMGLGLSIVASACRHLGHTVSVRSKPGVGSVFSIEMERVPAVTAPAPSSPQVVDSGRDADLDLIVTVIENDKDVLFATTAMLESWGASVLGAASTQEALDMVAEIGTAPDIIVADYQLDGDDTGAAAIRALREATGQHIPAIVVTADRSERVLRIGAEMDFTVLTKPLQLSRLRPLMDWKTRGGPAAATAGDSALPATDKSMA